MSPALPPPFPLDWDRELYREHEQQVREAERDTLTPDPPPPPCRDWDRELYREHEQQVMEAERDTLRAGVAANVGYGPGGAPPHHDAAAAYRDPAAAAYCEPAAAAAASYREPAACRRGGGGGGGTVPLNGDGTSPDWAGGAGALAGEGGRSGGGGGGAGGSYRRGGRDWARREGLGEVVVGGGARMEACSICSAGVCGGARIQDPGQPGSCALLLSHHHLFTSIVMSDPCL